MSPIHVNAYKWIESEVPIGLEVRQVYGFIFSPDGRILLLEDEGRYSLPGGKPENGFPVPRFTPSGALVILTPDIFTPD